MTAQNRATLKAEFETGDVPNGDNYADLIDSFVSLTDTSAQTVAGAVTFGGAISFTSTVTAATAAINGGLNVAGAVTAGSMDVLGTLTVSAKASMAGGLRVVGVVTAGSANVAGGLSIGGSFVTVTAQTTTTATGAVGGSTVPTTAQGYLKITSSGNTYLVPFFVPV